MHGTPDTQRSPGDDETALVAAVVALLADPGARTGTAEPIDVVLRPADALPQPERGLLAHDHGMTETLEARSGEILTLRTLSSLHRDDTLARHIALVTRRSGHAIGFGAIRLALASFDATARARIEGCEDPLGTILREEAVAHHRRVDAFLEVRAPAIARAAFGANDDRPLFGRHQVLRRPDGRELAEVVELLPASDRAEVHTP